MTPSQIIAREKTNLSPQIVDMLYHGVFANWLSHSIDCNLSIEPRQIAGQQMYKKCHYRKIISSSFYNSIIVKLFNLGVGFCRQTIAWFDLSHGLCINYIAIASLNVSQQSIGMKLSIVFITSWCCLLEFNRPIQWPKSMIIVHFDENRSRETNLK